MPRFARVYATSLTVVALGLGGVLAPAAARAETPTPVPVAPATPVAAEPTGPEPSTGTLDGSGLQSALKRDLGLTPEQFRTAARRAEVAAALQNTLASTPGFERVYLQGNTVVVAGRGPAVAKAAKQAGADLVAATSPRGIDNVRELQERYVAEVGGQGLVSVTETASGYVVRVSDPAQQAKARAFASKLGGVSVVAATPVKGLASLSAGQGIKIAVSGDTRVCSAGFTGYTRMGAPMVLTAGHCGEGAGGAVVYARDPSKEPVMGGSGALLPPLGKIAFARFGNGFDGGEGSDLATIESIGGYTLNPKVLRWGKAGGGATGNQLPVTGQVTPIIGAPVCRSGANTGWACARITDIGVAAVEVGGSVRYVDSLLAAGLRSAIGDSGGAMVMGNKAVGIVSGGGLLENGTPVTTGALLVSVPGQNLQSMNSIIPGYQVALHMNAPRVATTWWGNGRTVTGVLPPEAYDTIQPGTGVVVDVNGSTYTTARVDEKGQFSFVWNKPPGTYKVAMRGAYGHSRSPYTTFTVTTPRPFLGDHNLDGYADIVSISKDGYLHAFATTADLRLRDFAWRGAGYGDIVWLGQVPDRNGDGWTDLVMRDNAGRLFFVPGLGDGRFGSKRLLGKIGSYDAMTVLPDVTGDGSPELVGVRSSDKALVRWGLGWNGNLLASAVIGRGWQGTRSLASMGDRTGDGRADLLSLTSGHHFRQYPMTAAGEPTSASVQGLGWTYRAIFSPGDMNYDGRRDLAAVSPDGNYVYVYRNTGSGLSLVRLGTNLSRFRLFA